jgi:hypothetical protein
MRQLCGGGAHACRDLRVQSLPLAHASDVVSGFSHRPALPVNWLKYRCFMHSAGHFYRPTPIKLSEG